MSELDQRFSNYIQLKNQIQRLQKEAEVLRKRELTETISSIKEAIAAYELTAEDLGLTEAISSRRGPKSGKKAAAVGVSSGAKRLGRPAKRLRHQRVSMAARRAKIRRFQNLNLGIERRQLF